MILAVTLNPAIDLTVFGDNFKTGITNRGQEMYPDAGGKGNNAARIARLLGSDVMVTGFLGGFTGDFITTELEREGIRTAFYKINDLTRITLAFVDNSNQSETKVVPSGPKITAQQAEAFCSHFEELLIVNEFSILALCGSLANGLRDDYYSRLVGIAKTHDIPVVLDTSGSALKKGIESSPFLIKPNMDEAAELSGSSSADEIVAFLRKLTPEIETVALTLGKDGALFITKNHIIRARVTGVEAVNPVGSGDAFIGGFLTAYDRFGMDAHKLYSWSMAASACTAQSKGLLWPPDIFNEILKRVSIDIK
jgi:tagatose 6-phosphate kinase